jgi:hypothetical protein
LLAADCEGLAGPIVFAMVLLCGRSPGPTRCLSLAVCAAESSLSTSWPISEMGGLMCRLSRDQGRSDMRELREPAPTSIASATDFPGSHAGSEVFISSALKNPLPSFGTCSSASGWNKAPFASLRALCRSAPKSQSDEACFIPQGDPGCRREVDKVQFEEDVANNLRLSAPGTARSSSSVRPSLLVLVPSVRNTALDLGQVPGWRSPPYYL